MEKSLFREIYTQSSDSNRGIQFVPCLQFVLRYNLLTSTNVDFRGFYYCTPFNIIIMLYLINIIPPLLLNSKILILLYPLTLLLFYFFI